MFRCYSYTIIREHINSCLVFLWLLHKLACWVPIIFHILTVHLDIIKSFIYSPTDALVSCLKKQY